MPVLTQPVTELTTHVLHPIVSQMSHRILHTLDLTDTIQDLIYINTDWSTHSKTTDKNGNPILGKTGFVVDVNVQMNPNSQKFDTHTFGDTAAYGIDNRTVNNSKSIYEDPINRVRVSELRNPMTIVMNCALTVTSTEAAFQLPQKIFNKFENGSIYQFNDLVYDYPVPRDTMFVLFEIYKLDKNKGKAAGISFVEYLKIHSDGKWQLHRNRNTTDLELVVPSTNLQTLGIFEYSDDKPEGVKDNRLAVGFNINFMYTLQFSAPAMVILQYPSLITNRILDEKFIPIQTSGRFNRTPEFWHFNAMEDYSIDYGYRPMSHVVVPSYDDWKLPAPISLTNTQTPIAVLLIQCDEDKHGNVVETTVNLRERLDEAIDINWVVRDILYIQGAKSVEYNAIYNVSVFRNDKPLVPYEDYTFNHQLELKFTPANNYYQYHVVISVCNSIYLVDSVFSKIISFYYAYISPHFKSQIKAAIENGVPGVSSGMYYPNIPGYNHLYTGGATMTKVYRDPTTCPNYTDDGSGIPKCVKYTLEEAEACDQSTDACGWYDLVNQTNSSSSDPLGLLAGGYSSSFIGSFLTGVSGSTSAGYYDWRDPSWPAGTTIDEHGNIIDANGNLIGHISTSNYPLGSPSYEFGKLLEESTDGNSPTKEITTFFKYDIYAQRG